MKEGFYGFYYYRSIASKWIILAVALLVSYILLKIQKNTSVLLDVISNSLLMGFITLKLSLILLQPNLVINSPLSLLYFTGGKIGFWLAVIIASAVYFWGTRKLEILFQTKVQTYGLYVLYSFSVYHLLFLIMNQEWHHFFYLLIPIFVLIWWLLKNKSIQVLKNVTIMAVLSGLLGWAVYEHQTKTQSAEANANVQTGIQKGKKAVDFTLETINGEAKLSDYKGKKVILNFWATWCPPCKAEMPHMEKFYKENKTNNVVILAVNLTSSESDESNVRAFMKNYGLSFPVLMDADGSVGDTYQAITIPTTYFIDSEGIIQQKLVGPMSKDTMEDMIEKIN
ncbi:redoxin domain-containing protein [Neobacillus sp. FSL H8-0543]|uniref:redoxin domain-containing protein n=1 Tax=Neobacillus sp. FSL H8-0543 TaxID=2954672 RepID=UPI00315841DC